VCFPGDHGPVVQGCLGQGQLELPIQEGPVHVRVRVQAQLTGEGL